MRRNLYPLVLMLLLALCAVVVSAQDATVEPPVTVTVEATVEPTIATTLEPTAQATAEATVEATTPATAEATAQATAEVAVQPEIASTPTDTSAFVRVAHFAPDAPSVDIYINGTLAVKNLAFPSVSQWIALDPGTQSIAVTKAGDPVSSAVVGPVDVSASAGTWQTVAVIGSASSNTLQVAAIIEDYSDLLPSTGGFTFFNALEGSPTVNVVRSGVVYFAQLGYPGPHTSASSATLRGDSGSFSLSVEDANHPSTVFAQQPNLVLPENAYTLVALIGPQSDPRLLTLVTDRSEVEIARGLLPAPGKLLDALRANDNLTAFADALDSAGLRDTLSESQPYTLFAPANFVMNSSASAQTLLRGYIVEGKYTSRQLISAGTLTALDGSSLTITTDNNGILVNNVRLINVNIAATNGVIHMLNGSLQAGSK